MAATVSLKWRNRIIGADSIKVYRDTATFDINSLPSGGAIATLSDGVEEYTDSGAPEETEVFYGVTAVFGSKEVLSEVISLYTSSPGAVASSSVASGGGGGSGSNTLDPATLIASPENGFYFVFDEYNVYTDDPPTVLAGNGDSVQTITDSGPQNLEVSQATSGDQVVFQSADGGYLDFDTEGYYDTGFNFGDAERQTLMAKFRLPASRAGTTTIAGAYFDGTNRLYIGLDDNNVCAGVGDMASSVGAYLGPTVDDNEWHTVAVTVDKRSPLDGPVLFYLDGKQVGAGTYDYDLGGGTSGSNIAIGTRLLTGTTPQLNFRDDVAQVFYVEKEVTPDEIRRVHNHMMGLDVGPDVILGKGDKIIETTAATDLDLPFPTGIQAGELLIAVVCSSQPFGQDRWTTPSGWTRLLHRSNVTIDQDVNIYGLIASGSESGNLTVTQSLGYPCFGQIFRLPTGYDLTTTADSEANFISGSSTTTAPDVTSLSSANSLCFAIGIKPLPGQYNKAENTNRVFEILIREAIDVGSDEAGLIIGVCNLGSDTSPGTTDMRFHNSGTAGVGASHLLIATA